jgi:hypothetical protein
MAQAFDTLGYAQRLRDAGVPQGQAEAHAAAARDFLTTETDVRRLEAKIDALTNRVDRMELVLTVRFGGMIAAGIGMLYALNKLT